LLAWYVIESPDIRPETGVGEHPAYNHRASGDRGRTANGAADEPVC